MSFEFLFLGNSFHAGNVFNLHKCHFLNCHRLLQKPPESRLQLHDSNWVFAADTRPGHRRLYFNQYNDFLLGQINSPIVHRFRLASLGRNPQRHAPKHHRMRAFLVRQDLQRRYLLEGCIFRHCRGTQSGVCISLEHIEHASTCILGCSQDQRKRLYQRWKLNIYNTLKQL